MSDGIEVKATLNFVGNSGDVTAKPGQIQITGVHVLNRCWMFHLSVLVRVCVPMPVLLCVCMGYRSEPDSLYMYATIDML